MKRTMKQIAKALAVCLPMLLLLGCKSTGDKESLSGFVAYTPAQNETENAAAEELEEIIAGTAFVYICGEVEQPGVYEVMGDSRVCDVLVLAGGFTDRAAREAVNMAQKVQDGMQVLIPAKEEWEGTAETEDGRVNINTASAEQLQTLPGIGASRAAAIIAYREKEGSFATPEDIMKVSGIKESLYEDIAELIRIR